MSEPAKLRLFAAVDLPRRQLEDIRRATEALRRRWANGRWTPVENQHVTLKFLGWTPSERMGEVRSLCRTCAAGRAAAPVRVSGLGSFPSDRRMRVLWVGLDDPREVLASLAGELDRSLEPLGFEPEERAFTPHLTLARFKVPERLQEPLPEVLPRLEEFPVDELVLYRSHLSPRGPRYEPLDRFPLGG